MIVTVPLFIINYLETIEFTSVFRKHQVAVPISCYIVLCGIAEMVRAKSREEKQYEKAKGLFDVIINQRKRDTIMQSIFEKMGGKYIKVGDYYVPDLGQFNGEEEPVDDRLLGKYGMLREAYLKEHRHTLYSSLLSSFKLSSHLRDVEEQAQEILDTLISQYKEKQGVTEELKATDQMEWVGRMNNIKAQIEEIIFSEIVYI